MATRTKSPSEIPLDGMAVDRPVWKRMRKICRQLGLRMRTQATEAIAQRCNELERMSCERK